MKKHSKILCLALSLIMMLSLMPMTAFATGTHTVTFKANGHGGDSEGNLLVLTVEDGSSIDNTLTEEQYFALYNKPIQDGIKYYRVDDFYTDAACTGSAYDIESVVTADIVLYADWSEVSAPTTELNVTANIPTITDEMPFDNFVSGLTVSSNLNSSDFEQQMFIVDLISGDMLGEEDVFSEGGAYGLSISYVDKTGTNWFSENVAVKLNGTTLEEGTMGNIPTKNSYFNYSDGLQVYYVFGIAVTPRIESVNLTVAIPDYDGMTVKELKEAVQISHDLGETVSVEIVEVMDGSNILVDDTVISAGNEYMLFFGMKSDANLFANNVDLTLNGKSPDEYPTDTLMHGVAEEDGEIYLVVYVSFSQLQVEYTITAGANQEWTKGTTTGLVVTSDADFANFTEVKVDGVVVDATNYDVASGSTKVTLKPAYLETLAVGTHTLDIVSTNGTASTSFTIKAATGETTGGGTTSPDGNGNTEGGNNDGNTNPDGNTGGIDNNNPGGSTGNDNTNPGNDNNGDATNPGGTTGGNNNTGNKPNPGTGTLYDVPKTGDNSNMLLWVAMILVSGLALVGTALYGRKKRAK